MPRACRQAVGTTASTTNGTQGPRAAIVAFGSLNWVHLRNLWMARISLLWLRLGRARSICEICGFLRQALGTRASTNLFEFFAHAGSPQKVR